MVLKLEGDVNNSEQDMNFADSIFRRTAGMMINY